MSNFDAKDALTRELHERATDVGGHPIDLAGVKGRARGIRRRRQIVTGAVAAVVAGVAIPAGLTLTSGPTGYVPQPADQPGATASPTATPTPRADGTFRLTTRDLPRGGAPGVSYVVGRKLVTSDGEVTLPESYRQIAPVLGGWQAVGSGANGDTVVVLTSDMKVESTSPGGPSFVMSADGSRILFSERDYHEPGLTIVKDNPTKVGYQDEAMSWWAPKNSEVEPVGYLATGAGESRVVYQTMENTQVLMGTPDGESVPLKGFVNASDASAANGLVAGMTSYEPGKVCFGVMEPEVSTTTMVARTCDYRLEAFSPDGRFVLGGTPEADGAWGTPTLAVLDARTLEPIVEFTPDKNVMTGIPQAVWEDDDTILASVVEGNDMTMVRLELSGQLEAASDSYSTQDMTLPFWFSGSPRW
jgi:hypothetical protein